MSFIFRYTDNGLRLEHYNGGPEKNVDIPPWVDGETVTKIGSWAFGYAEGLCRVIIPSGVTSIEYNAFECADVPWISIPESVTDIGEDAFVHSGLTSVSIPFGVKIVQNGTFRECSRLEEVCLHEGLTAINNLAFANCTNLKSVSLPMGVKRLGIRAFAGCSNLISVTIGPGLREIGYGAFRSCDNLEDIHICNARPAALWRLLFFRKHIGLKKTTRIHYHYSINAKRCF